MSRATLQNWSGSHRFIAAEVVQPTSVDELTALITRSARLKALGTRHCFTPVADSDGVLVSLAAMPADIEIDPAARTVRVAAGITYRDLAPVLHDAGFALANLASLPHVSVGGAVATGTHGSGDELGNLATAVRAVELIDGTGAPHRFERGHDDTFAAAVVALGMLGIVTHLTLDLVDAFDLVQQVYLDLPYEAVFDDFDRITTAGYSVSLFPTWQAEHCERLMIKRRVGAGGALPQFADTFLGARLAAPGTGGIRLPDRDGTPNGVPGAWHERLPHFVLHDPLATGNELQSEYLVARHHAPAALRVVRGLRERLRDVIFVSEIRTMAADDLWLSGAYGTDTVGIHFSWLDRRAAVDALLPELEAALAPFEPRPHWGKLFAGAGFDPARRYPRHGEFVRLCRELDPHGRFRNIFTDRYVRVGD